MAQPCFAVLPSLWCSPIPALAPGNNTLRFEAKVGFSRGIFDQSIFDFSIFDQDDLRETALFDEAVFGSSAFASSDPFVDATFTYTQLTPASFMVRIPWDMPPFTDQLDNIVDQPRNQIKYIVEKVKAAGVEAIIAYEKRFTEAQEMEEQFKLGPAYTPDQGMEEVNFDMKSVQTPYGSGLDQGLDDKLLLSGVFGYTTFGSLNTFA